MNTNDHHHFKRSQVKLISDCNNLNFQTKFNMLQAQLNPLWLNPATLDLRH